MMATVDQDNGYTTVSDMLWFIVLQWQLVVDSRLVFPTDIGCCVIDPFSFWCSVDSLMSVPGVIDVELAWIECSTLMQSLQEMNAKQDMQVAIRASPRKIRKRYHIVNPGIVKAKSSVIFTSKTEIHLQMYLDISRNLILRLAEWFMYKLFHR